MIFRRRTKRDEVKKSQTARRYFESRLRRLKVLDRLAEIGGVREPAKP